MPVLSIYIISFIVSFIGIFMLAHAERSTLKYDKGARFMGSTNLFMGTNWLIH